MCSEKLRNSKFGNEDDINLMMEHFERSTKLTFKDPKEKTYIKFRSIRDTDPAVGIKGGQLQLEGYVHCDLFQFLQHEPPFRVVVYRNIGVK